MEHRNVITIATSDGAYAEEIGRQSAARLGYRYVNEEVISMAAKKARVSPDDIDEVEHAKPLARRMVAAIASLAAVETVFADANELYGLSPVVQWNAGPTVTRRRAELYKNLIREVLWELSLEGNVVIVAHAASMQLRGAAGLMRIFVTASAEVRAERVAHAQGLLAGDARKQIEHADQQRRAYLRSFHDVQQELPTHYDLVVNTDHLPVSAAVDVIVAAAHPAPAPQPAMALVQSR